MRFGEYPLLNAPNLVVIILKQGAEAPATLDDCAASLAALLARADEHPPFGPKEVAGRLEMLIRYLTEARLLQPAGGGTFVATARGRAALDEHPQGFDTADLMAYPEFARYIRGLDLRRGPSIPGRAATTRASPPTGPARGPRTIPIRRTAPTTSPGKTAGRRRSTDPANRSARCPRRRLIGGTPEARASHAAARVRCSTTCCKD